MCGSKEPVAGVFLLLLLAAGGLVVQEPFPHFGIEVSPEILLNGEDASKPVPTRPTTRAAENGYTSATHDDSGLYSAIEGR